MSRNQPVIQALIQVLADTYAMMTKTQHHHWNVEGPRFKELHDQFQLLYEAHFLQVDELAERIRALGGYPPGTLQEFAQISSVRESPGLRGEDAMVRDLVGGYEALIADLRRLWKATDEHGDPVTQGIAESLILAHEKTVWMLRSMLKA
ncbi:MAG: DNA starvation/stationary phase protection protein [Armatimonadetes bacterium]|nr:DNA starvation/stationary phase protection protein [Armatimonadota bacterium]MCA1997163.1 DNA starvation/stationary phase protection protein [Armatimonadota bacterium]